MDIQDSISAPTYAAGLAPAHTPSKLHDAAQQFESLMVGEMLKSVRESGSGGWLGSVDGDDDGDSGSETATETAETQFANALASGGGIGLARIIEQKLGQEKNQNVAAMDPAAALSK